MSKKGSTSEGAQGAAAVTTEAPPAPTVEVLRVTARPARGFYRAGRYWPPEPTEVPAAEFTAEQLGALQAESNLVVEVLSLGE